MLGFLAKGLAQAVTAQLVWTRLFAIVPQAPAARHNLHSTSIQGRDPSTETSRCAVDVGFAKLVEEVSQQSGSHCEPL